MHELHKHNHSPFVPVTLGKKVPDPFGRVEPDAYGIAIEEAIFLVCRTGIEGRSGKMQGQRASRVRQLIGYPRTGGKQ